MENNKNNKLYNVLGSYQINGHTGFYINVVKTFPLCFKAPGWEDNLTCMDGFSQTPAL